MSVPLQYLLELFFLIFSGSRRKSSSCYPGTSYSDLEVTHRGMHRFIPRHADELAIEIGDPLHVIKTGDDLWCEGMTCLELFFHVGLIKENR